MLSSSGLFSRDLIAQVLAEPEITYFMRTHTHPLGSTVLASTSPQHKACHLNSRLSITVTLSRKPEIDSADRTIGHGSVLQTASTMNIQSLLDHEFPMNKDAKFERGFVCARMLRERPLPIREVF